jgi:hypothetical protein
MRKKAAIRSFTFVIMFFLLILTNSCKKTEVTEDANLPSVIPVVTTSAVIYITPHSASCGGNITWGGGSAIIARGVCWSTYQSITIDQCLNKIKDGENIGSFSSFIEGLNYNTTYYVCAYATNSNGTGYGNLVSFKTVYSIGESYGGGKIFYIDGTGQHGLISATRDQSTGTAWGCQGTLTGSTGTAIGTGQANTTAIVNRCNAGGTAAQICDTLVLNGYNDWFLPSQDELNQMIIHKNVIGGFASNKYYWSSSEGDLNSAWTYSSANLVKVSTSKGDTTIRVRAVRAF